MSESEKPVTMESYIKLCIIILICVGCAVGGMIWTSFLPHIGWTEKVVIILAIAAVNAFLVAGYLMHLLSEKKLIYTLLGFTVFFFAGLLALTLYAMQDFPAGTTMH